MPNLIDPMASMIVKLNALLAGPYAGAKLKLSSNNVTITESTVLADFTECTATGYSAQTLTGWGSAADDGSHHAFSTANPVNFTFTSGSGNLYNAYITNSAGTALLDAGTFASPPLIVAAGVTLTITAVALQGDIY